MSTTPPQLPPKERLGDNIGARLALPVGRSGHAIAAGYLGLFSVLLVPAPFALLFGVLAVRSINHSKRHPPKKYGMGRAVFGIIMGALGTPALAMVLYSALLKA